MIPPPPDHLAFIRQHTALSSARLVTGIKLHLATEITPLWQASEAFLQAYNMPPPFWAFAWPGSEALARYVTDHPGLVAGRRILDFASGCGLAGIACAQAGAACVEAAEIDPFAAAAIALNAAENKCEINVLLGDVVGTPCCWDVILCGDVCYEAPMARHILPWLRSCAAQAIVIMADPGRKYAPAEGGAPLARLEVQTSLDLEDLASRWVDLVRLEAEPVATS